MECIHQDLLRNGRLADVQRPHPVASITFATPADKLPRHGVNARFAQATFNALHALALRECGEDQSVPTAFMELVQRIDNQRKVRGSRSVELIHFLGLSAHYGIRFASLDDLIEVVSVLHDLIAPNISHHKKPQQRRDYWLLCGNFFAVLGEHVTDKLVADELEEGVRSGMFVNTSLLVARIRPTLPGNKLLALGVYSHLREIDPHKLATLINLHPERVDDLVELMRHGLLDQVVLGELLAEPDLFAALCLRAVDELVSLRDEGTSLLDTARLLASDLRDTNMAVELELAQADMDDGKEDEEESFEAEVEEEPEAEEPAVEEDPEPPPYDHTKLDITEAVGTRKGSALEAMQILLVHGVIQPDLTVSPMMNGSKVPREDVDELCRPHLDRAGISDQQYEQAIGFLTTVKVLGTEVKGGRKRGNKKLRSRRIWFNKTVNGIPRGQMIASAVLALNATVR